MPAAPRPARRPWRTALALAWACAALSLHAGPAAAAAGVYFTRAELLKSFFQDSERVSYRAFELDEVQRRRLTQRLGYAAAAKHTIYYGERGGRVTGYAVLDDELGQHQPISFGVLLSPDGRVLRVEVMVYREPKGDEVRRAQFRDQFVGKGADAPLQAGRDIVAVAGATLSSRALAVGVRRAAIVVEELLLSGTARASAAP